MYADHDIILRALGKAQHHVAAKEWSIALDLVLATVAMIDGDAIPGEIRPRLDRLSAEPTDSAGEALALAAVQVLADLAVLAMTRKELDERRSVYERLRDR